jgi:hypothetical protein
LSPINDVAFEFLEKRDIGNSMEKYIEISLGSFGNEKRNDADRKSNQEYRQTNP